eukprot:gene7404-10093_t
MDPTEATRLISNGNSGSSSLSLKNPTGHIAMTTISAKSNNSTSLGNGNSNSDNLYTQRRNIEEPMDDIEDYSSRSKSICGADCIKSFVFGGSDGIISSLAIISGASGGGFPWRVILVLGFSNIVANSLHTGISEFLSSKAHKEFLQAEKRRETWEFKHYRDAEINAMIKRFESRGMSHVDAELVVNRMAQYESFFVTLMVSEELGLQLPDDDDAMLLTDAFIMFLSFALCGAIPLFFFTMGPLELMNDNQLYTIASLSSIIILFVLGVVKSTYSSANWLYSGLESMILGIICCTVSYFLGATVMDLIAFI